MLVKPVNTPELLRQLEALLITHQDQKMGQNAEEPSRGGQNAYLHAET